jgi:CHU_C Type IX secretion signal domain
MPTYSPVNTGATSKDIEVTAPGNYTIVVSNICQETQQSIAINWAGSSEINTVFVPNVIQPELAQNGGFRAFFSPEVEVTQFQLAIFDRWGSSVFVTKDITQEWLGEIQGRPADTGVYVWWLEADLNFCGRTWKLKKSGDVTVVR